jgi:hypothetical protein
MDRNSKYFNDFQAQYRGAAAAVLQDSFQETNDKLYIDKKGPCSSEDEEILNFGAGVLARNISIIGDIPKDLIETFKTYIRSRVSEGSQFFSVNSKFRVIDNFELVSAFLQLFWQFNLTVYNFNITASDITNRNEKIEFMYLRKSLIARHFSKIINLELHIPVTSNTFNDFYYFLSLLCRKTPSLLSLDLTTIIFDMSDIPKIINIMKTHPRLKILKFDESQLYVFEDFDIIQSIKHLDYPLEIQIGEKKIYL